MMRKYVRVLGRDTYPEGTGPDTLSVLDASQFPPEIKATVDVQHTVIAPPQAVPIAPDGKLAILLAGTVGGTVAVLEIEGKIVKLVEQIKVSAKRVSGISFTHDGRAALVALRDEQGITVLDVEGSRVTNTQERVTTGVSPFGRRFE
jgi:hypothetical protein